MKNIKIHKLFIEKYMGCIKTSKEIRDHIGQVKRARRRLKDYEHPYVLYEKTNKKKIQTNG